VLANLVNFLSPDMVVLGGGLVKSMGAIIVPEVRRSLYRHALPPIGDKVEVTAALLGDLAVATGAAKRALDRLGPR
jgi:glucokinase